MVPTGGAQAPPVAVPVAPRKKPGNEGGGLGLAGDASTTPQTAP
jgi:hypothetical protein